jgi:acetylglutamate kinase
MSRYDAQPRWEVLIEALPFIQKFRGCTFVIKYGGSAMEDETIVERLLQDVVFLEAVGINPVLVHGGGKSITSRMREAGLQSRFVNGLRVTDEQSIQIVEEILDGTINPRIVQTINDFGGKAQGFSGKNILLAQKLGPQPDGKGGKVDVGFVGEVSGTNLSEVRRAIDAEIVPVISPIAVDASGHVLNVNADIAAGAIASELKATKMIYLSDVEGIMRDTSRKESLIPSVNRSMIAKLIEEEVIAGGMLPKVDSAVKALESGVGKVHFIDGRIPHSLLLEIFTTSGIGTEIVP